MTLQQRSFAPTPIVAPTTLASVEPLVSLSGPVVADFDIYRGDTGRFRITVTDDLAAPVDVSGATWDADIRLTPSSVATITSFDVVPVSGDTSSVDVILDETNADLLIAGTLVYDVEMRLAGEVITLVKGDLNVTQDVSRPT